MGFKKFIKRKTQEATGIGLSEKQKSELRKRKLEELKFRQQKEKLQTQILQSRKAREKLKPQSSGFFSTPAPQQVKTIVRTPTKKKKKKSAVKYVYVEKPTKRVNPFEDSLLDEPRLR